MKRADLARVAGCSKSLISDLLNGAKNATQFLPEIHAALGWTPPAPPVADQDRDEVIALFNKLSAKSRERWIGFGQAMVDADKSDRDKQGKKG